MEQNNIKAIGKCLGAIIVTLYPDLDGAMIAQFESALNQCTTVAQVFEGCTDILTMLAANTSSEG